VKAGYDSRDRIIDLVSTKEGASRDLVAAEVDRALAEHAKEQATWKGRTDCDKLDAAFAALEKEGIFVRPHFETSQDAADPLLEAEAKRFRAAGRPVRGWAYWNESTTKLAIDEGSLFIIYGGLGKTDESWGAIAATIETRLKAAGLKAEWPYRTAAYPVNVTLDWKKRR